jgi:hypothetical protein
MIEEAAQRSRTFSRLVNAIEATNGIVYVEHGACGHSVRACLSLHVVPAGGYRILRVMVDARQRDWEVMASIGHELQHALEVLGNVALTTTEAVFLFYSHGQTSGDSFETTEAIKAGNSVRNEVASHETQVVAATSTRTVFRPGVFRAFGVAHRDRLCLHGTVLAGRTSQCRDVDRESASR